MGKSAIYTVNSAGTAYAIGAAISPGNIVRKYGNNADLSGNAISLAGAGFYEASVNATVTSATAGTATISLYKDGTVVPGATASVALLADGTGSVSFDSIVRNYCCNVSALTVVVSGLAVTVNNLAMVVEKM